VYKLLSMLVFRMEYCKVIHARYEKAWENLLNTGKIVQKMCISPWRSGGGETTKETNHI
jgi:hypothetical protein